MRKSAQHDEKDNERGNPAPIFVSVDDLVSREGDEEGAESDNEDSSIARNVAVDGVEKLGAHDSVGSRPTDACQDIENGDFRSWMLVSRSH